MRRATPVLISVVGLVAGLLIAPAAAHATARTWTADDTMLAPPLPNGTLASVSCPAAGSCVAVGSYVSRGGYDKSLIEVLTSGKWTIVGSPNPANATGTQLYGVSCASVTACIAVGYATVGGHSTAVIEKLSGGTWRNVAPPAVSGSAGSYLYAVSCSSATACVAVGENDTNGGINRPLVETLSAGTWSVTSAPNPAGATSTYLNGVSCPSASACVAVGTGNPGGGDSKGIVEVLTAGTWAIQHTPLPAGSTSSGFSSVSCTSATSCMAVGQYTSHAGAAKTLAEQLTGSTWAISPSKSVTGAGYITLYGVSCTSSTTCAATGYYYDSSNHAKVLAETFSSGAWTVSSIQKPAGVDNSELLGVACTAADACAAVGDSYGTGPDSPLAESFGGTKWSIASTQKAPGPLNSQMLGVSCASTTMCMAVGAINVDTGTGLAELWNGSTWTVTPTPNPDNSDAQLWSVSCPTTTFCVAVGDASGKGLGAIWNGSAWTLAYTAFPSGADSSALMSVSCPSTTLCFASGWKISGGAGHGLVEKWNGSTWSVMTTPDPTGDVASYLYGISCASTSSCIAVGDGPNASFDYHGYAEKFDGATWTQTSVTGGSGLTGVSCVSSTYCVAVGYDTGPFASTWNGTSWSATAVGLPAGSDSGAFQSVSCTSTTACTAVGNESTSSVQGTLAERFDGTNWSVDVSRDPRGTTSSELDDVSCVSSLCYAVGSGQAETNVPFAEYTTS